MNSETTLSWRENLLADLQKRREKKSRKGPAIHPGAFRHALMPLAVHCAVEFVGLVDQAARKRDVNRSSYVRRAISVLVAHDLDMPVHQVVYETPCIGKWGRVQNSPGERDLGEGIEEWCPHPGCDGEHLSLR